MARIAEINSTGGPEVIEWVTRDLPEPGEGEVRIRSTAIGLNFIDIYHRRGSYNIALPSGLGSETPLPSLRQTLGPARFASSAFRAVRHFCLRRPLSTAEDFPRLPISLSGLKSLRSPTRTRIGRALIC